MPGRDRKLDPLTGDYIPDGAGGWEMVDTIESEVMHRLRDRYDSFAGDPSHGSKLHLVTQGNLSNVDRLRAKGYAELALQPIVDGGRGANLKVEAKINSADKRIEIETSITDIQSAPVDVSQVTPFRE